VRSRPFDSVVSNVLTLLAVPLPIWLGWLCVRYFAECADFKRLEARTRHVRRMILESTFDEPIAPGSSKFFRDFSAFPNGHGRGRSAA
jgi:hypothetical protein